MDRDPGEWRCFNSAGLSPGRKPSPTTGLFRQARSLAAESAAQTLDWFDATTSECSRASQPLPAHPATDALRAAVVSPVDSGVPSRPVRQRPQRESGQAPQFLAFEIIGIAQRLHVSTRVGDFGHQLVSQFRLAFPRKMLRPEFRDLCVFHSITRIVDFESRRFMRAIGAAANSVYAWRNTLGSTFCSVLPGVRAHFLVADGTNHNSPRVL
jgi:hypothetical protein